MESAKKQKLSPDSETSEFQAFSAPGMPSAETEAFPRLVEAQKFGLPEGFWKWLEGDAELTAEFNQMIQARVEAGLRAQFDELKATVEAEARDAGFKQGAEMAKREYTERFAQLDRIGQELLAERVKIMKSHEAEWLRGLGYVLKRFMVPERKLALEGIESWLSEGIGSLDQKITVRLSPADYVRMSTELQSLGQSSVTFTRDADINEGDVRCESETGGILFSSEAHLKKLNDWIDSQVARSKA